MTKFHDLRTHWIKSYWKALLTNRAPGSYGNALRIALQLDPIDLRSNVIAPTYRHYGLELSW